MNLVLLIGAMLLGSISEAEPLVDNRVNPCDESFANNHNPCMFPEKVSERQVSLEEFTYAPLENIYDLGFDTSDYLPEGFDPSQEYVNLEALKYESLETEADIAGADLPENFDPYAAPSDPMNISYMELEEEENLIFPEVDTANYLPMDFDPYARDYITVAEGFQDGVVIIRATIGAGQ